MVSRQWYIQARKHTLCRWLRSTAILKMRISVLNLMCVLMGFGGVRNKDIGCPKGVSATPVRLLSSSL
jgi:hypothetical protein